MAKKKEVTVQENKKFAEATIKDFEVILAPVVTEKTMHLQQSENKITVKVNSKSNKEEIKDAFESVFNVKVVDVHVMNVRPRIKRAGRYVGHVPGYKKAIITLSPDEDLNVLAQDAASND